MHTVVYPIDALKIGGAEQQLLELVRGLDKTRFRPIVTPVDAGGQLDAEFRAVPGVEVVDLHRRGKLDLRPLWTLGRVLRARRASIVQPFLTPATFFGLVPALFTHTPIKIVTERCGVRRTRGLGYTTYRVLEDQLTRFAETVVANSMAGRDLLVSRGIPISKVQVVYNGISPGRLHVNPAKAAAHRARLRVPADGHVISILASLTMAKGHDVLLQAVAALVASRPGVRVAIIGDGPRRAELEAQAVASGLADHVVFFGFQRQVADYLAASDILVCSSRDNEGCSNSILEAMALSVPVIATRVGGNPELVDDGVTGWLVPTDDPVALADTLDRVLANPAGRKAVGERSRRQVDKRFSLQRMVADYEQLYDRLLIERRTASRHQPAAIGDVPPGG